jgi:pimeloyl-ACP methyl ester carboxylesterase
MVEHQVVTRNGVDIPVQSVGAGPGIVVVTGGGVTSKQYRRFATALAGQATVHLYNRRGRADAAGRDTGYTISEDIDDLAAVLERTGSRSVVGHSGGGFVVLRAALELSLDRIALYDAAVNVDNIFPSGYLDDFEAAVDAGDQARAIAVVGKGLRSAGALSNLPLGIRIAIAKLFLRTPIGRTMGELLPTTLLEVREIQAYAGPAADYAGITAEVLLSTGAWSPPYYRAVNDALARVMPQVRTEVVPRSGHDGINIARAAFMKPFASFFTTPIPAH